MGNLRFEPALPAHIDELIADIRPLDRQEVEAGSGDLRTTLTLALKLTDHPVTCRCKDGTLVCIFGAAPLTLTSDTASIWLLGTTAMSRHPREVLEATRSFIVLLSERYSLLVNYVDARNRPSIRWLRSVGFNIEPARPFGVAGQPFHRFHMGL